MKSILLLEIGNHLYDNDLSVILKEKYKITRHDVYTHTILENFDEFDYLILGCLKDTDEIYNLEKISSDDPIHKVFYIIKQFRYKPVLGYGYGCCVLGVYYNCKIVPLDIRNENDKQHLIIDNRYKITKTTLNPSKLNATFDNKYKLIVPMNNSIDLVVFCAKPSFDPCGFKFFMNNYGFLFILDSEYGKIILENFLSHS
jgi:hypothetical protein